MDEESKPYNERMTKIAEQLEGAAHRRLAESIQKMRAIMPELSQTLDEFNIDHCFLGGAVLPLYSYARTTEDVDVLISGKDEGKIEREIKPDYMHKITLPDGRALYTWKESGIIIGFVYSGRVYGQNGMAYPEPSQISTITDGLKVISLPALIQHKLDSGSNPRRHKDLGDVDGLIVANKLPRTYASKHNFRKDLARDYRKQWDAVRNFPDVKR